MKKILFILILVLLSSLVYATPINQTFPDIVTESTTGLLPLIYGEQFKTKTYPLTLTKVFVHSGNTAGRVCVYANVSSISPLICSTTYVGDAFTFDFDLNASTVYIIAADNSGSDWTTKYDLSPAINGWQSPREFYKFINYTQHVYSTIYSATPTWTNLNGWSTIYSLEFTNPLTASDYIFGCLGLANDTIAYNFTIHNEFTNDLLGSDVAVDLNYLSQNVSIQLSNVNSIAICIVNGTPFYTNGVLYITTNNNLNKYFLTDDLYTNYTKNISLYNIPYPVTVGANISTLRVTIQNYLGDGFSGLIGKLLRYYPQNHTWVTVQMDDSDTYGRLYYEIVEQNVEYLLDIYNNTDLLYTTEKKMKYTCVNNACDITIKIFPIETTLPKTQFNYTYSNITNILTINYEDTSSTLIWINATVKKQTVTGLSTLCDTSAATTSGVMTCNLAGYTGQVMLRVISSKTTPRYELFEFINLGSTSLGDVVGLAESGFWVFGLSMTIAAIGLFSPVGVILMFVASLWIISLLGFLNIISVPFLVIATAMGLFIGYQLKT